MAIEVAEPVFPLSSSHFTVTLLYCLPLYHMFQNNLKTGKDHGSIRCMDNYGPHSGNCCCCWMN